MSYPARIANDENQWIDPALLTLANGSKEWARWATKYLYENVTDRQVSSETWPKTGLITQFDRALSIPLAASNIVGNRLTTGQASLQTNNRNWLLLSRSAVVLDENGVIQDLNSIAVKCEVPPSTFTIEDQPAGLVFGSGEWPAVLPFPEEWTQNITRTWYATNLRDVPLTLNISLKFLQVRTN